LPEKQVLEAREKAAFENGAFVVAILGQAFDFSERSMAMAR
jgi:hypothetical protein